MYPMPFFVTMKSSRPTPSSFFRSRFTLTDSYVDDNTLTVNVNRLRRKLDGAGLTDFIVTKKGTGYMVK